jgi:hypothetical protein
MSEFCRKHGYNYYRKPCLVCKIESLEQAGDELVKMVERGMGGYLEYHREEAEKALADWQKVRGNE